MSIVKVTQNTYTVEPLHQWDVNQVLQVYGMSLAKAPEVHFTNAATSRAIVRQATMDAAGVITVSVPNSLLQKPYAITAHICGYTGTTFETFYKLAVPVRERAQPADYVLINDEEVYSFNSLENAVVNSQRDMVTATETLKTTNTNMDQLVDAAVLKKFNETMDETLQPAVAEATNAAMADLLDDTLTDEAKAANAKATGDALRTKARVVVGTYTGTNKYGGENKNNLSFDGKLLAICIDGSVVSDGTNTLYGGYVWVRGASCGKVTEKTEARLTWGEQSVSWYTTYSGGAAVQLNLSKTYHYVAILEDV